MKRKNIFLTFGAFVLYSLVVFLALTSVAMVSLNNYLTEYEAYQPSTVSDTVLSYFQNRDSEALNSIASDEPKMDNDMLKAYLNKVIDNESLFFYKASSGDNSISYDIISNNKKVATFTLEKSGQKSKHGLDEYTIQNLIWHPILSYTITAPADCDIYVNSKKLDAVPEVIDSCNEYNSFDGSSFKTVKYTIDYFELITDIRAESVNSAKCVLLDSTDGNYIFEYELPEETAEKVTATAEKAAKSYILFSTKRNVPVSSVLLYIHSKSALYKYLKMFDNTWSYTYQKDNYNKFEISDLKLYSDSKVSCKVSAVYEIYQYNGKTETFDFDYNIYFTEHNGNWYITSMERIAK